jgi:DNA-binding LacI/PurR family transcriptional regulator
MAATLADVAKIAGVSIKTVSNVIHDYPHLRPETKARVLAAIRKINYRPNLNARNLRSGRTGVIGLVIPTLRNPYFAELAEAVIDAANRRGVSVLIEQSPSAPEDGSPSGRATRTQLVDGVLFSAMAPGREDTGLYGQIASSSTGERDAGEPADHVTMRNTEAIRAATEHLIGLGRTRIAVLGTRPGDVSGTASLRLLGYQQALATAGIPLDQTLLRPVITWNRFDGAAATQSLIDSGIEFDGIVCFNDSLALGAIRVLGQNAIRVPQDVAVIGFDDLDESRYSLPSLTTISPGREEIAALAVEMLLERINARDDVIAPREVTVPFTLVARESTAPAGVDL